MGNSSTLQDLFRGLPRFGDLPAIVVPKKEGAEIWSYAKLSDHVARLSAGFVQAGLCRGDRVALFARNCPEWIVACLAAIQAGGMAVPVDAQLGDNALRRVLRDSDPRFLFTSIDELPCLQATGDSTGWRTFLFDTDNSDPRSWRGLLSDSLVDFPPPVPDESVALFYTSGTTGSAKGVPLTHRNLAFQLDSIAATNLIRQADRMLLPLPLHHAYPFVIGMLTPLALGLPIILPQMLTGPQVIRAIREGRATVVIGVPRLYDALCAGLEARVQSGPGIVALLFRACLATSLLLRRHLHLRLGKWLLHPLHWEFGRQVRLMASGGAALDPKLALKLEAIGWQVAIGYGLTETSPLLTLNPPGTTKFNAVGRPLRGTEIRIDSGASCSWAGKSPIGEVLARGPSVFTGYWNLPQKTAEAFAPNGWFRTGDIGFLDDEDYLHLTGRLSTMIVTGGGEKIQPEDLEEAYLENPSIGEIGILQKDNKLVAVIFPNLTHFRKIGIGKADQAIRDALQATAKRLPSYQRISDFVLVRDPLLRTRLGKIRRHLLASRYERAKAALEGHSDNRPMLLEEMSDEDRAMLDDVAARQAWDLLASRYHDLSLAPGSSPQFDLGIDSMEWLNLTLDLRQHAGVELPEDAIGRIETVRDLLREVSEARRNATPGLFWLDQPDAILSEEQLRDLRPQGSALRAFARMLLAFDTVLAQHFLQLRVRGRENLPAQRQFVLISNHLSYLDPLVLAVAIGYRRMRETYWAGMTTNPFNRLMKRIAQIVPIDPERAVLSSMAFGAAVLQRGKNLVWFPEGTISSGGHLLPFRHGIGMLLERFQTLAVPVLISGTNRVLPFGKFIPRPSAVIIEFGKPLSPSELEREGEGSQPSERIVSALRKHVLKLQESATAPG